MTKETIIKSTLKYLVKRQIEEGSVGFAVDNDPDHDCCWDDVLAWIEAQPNSNEFFNFDAPMVKNSEAVSREAVETFKEELIDKLAYTGYTEEYKDEIIDIINQMPPVTPSYNSIKTELKPCEDCISRQAVIDFIIDNYGVGFNSLTNGIRDYLPSVTPERPKGHWIIIDDCELFMAKCSECGEIVDSRMINKYPYCHCGAYMGGEDETN